MGKEQVISFDEVVARLVLNAARKNGMPLKNPQRTQHLEKYVPV